LILKLKVALYSSFSVRERKIKQQCLIFYFSKGKKERITHFLWLKAKNKLLLFTKKWNVDITRIVLILETGCLLIVLLNRYCNCNVMFNFDFILSFITFMFGRYLFQNGSSYNPEWSLSRLYYYAANQLAFNKCKSWRSLFPCCGSVAPWSAVPSPHTGTTPRQEQCPFSAKKITTKNQTLSLKFPTILLIWHF
jgi:hypothetical protein